MAEWYKQSHPMMAGLVSHTVPVTGPHGFFQYHLILDLLHLNQYVHSIYFKMKMVRMVVLALQH